MANRSKFLSVNLNKTYGQPSSSTYGYGNARPRSVGGAGGMVVLSRPRSSSGASAHKNASKLAVPPPVNLPSLRKEHERLDPASSKPSSVHGSSGLGPGNGLSMGWTKPGLSSGEQHGIAGDASPQVLMEKTVILKGEDFPSLRATSASSTKPKQRQISEKSDGWEEKTELSSILDMRPRLSALIKNNAHSRDYGSIRIPHPAEQLRQEDANFRAPLPPVRLRHKSDWNDDERDRNYGASDDREGRLLLDGEAHSLLSRDSGRGDLHGREFMKSIKADHNVNYWRVPTQLNRDFSMPRELHVDGDHVGDRNSSVGRRTGQEKSHAGLFNGDKRDFGPVVGIGNVEVAEAFNDRAEVSNNWQRGKPFSSGMITRGPTPSGVNSFLSKDPVLNFRKEKAVSNVGKSHVEAANWSGKGLLSSGAMLDLNAKVFRKKKEAKPSNFIDPVRESFEAELERVQQLQELERQRVMEEQAKAIEFARREVEERERRLREEEERKRSLDEEAREAAWRAEQEKLEASRRTEEQRIAIKEEKKRILVEEERRKEAALQKLLELEARIAKRQILANTTDDRMKERDPSKDSDQAEWEKTEGIVEPFTTCPSSESSFMNGLSEAGFRTHSSDVENYSFCQRGRLENNWSRNNNSNFNFQGQDNDYPSSRHDAFFSKRGLHGKQFQGNDAPMPLVPSFKKGMSANHTETGQSWDRNNDCDQFNGSCSNIDANFGAWDHGHFSGSQHAHYSQRSFQNTEVEDLVSISRVRHTLRQPRVPPPPSSSSSRLKNSFGASSEGPNSSLSVNSDVRSDLTGGKEESDLQIGYSCRYQQIIEEPGTAELLEETASSLLQTEDKSSPRYGSQSSLSVSSPPSSPTQHSHDELDDFRGSSARTTSVEEENIAFSDSKPIMPELDAEHINSETTPFCHEEDDEWTVDNNEEMQEGDHDEFHDIYQEDNEDHEGDAGNLQMVNKLDDMDAVVKKPDEGMKNSCGRILVCPQLGDSVHEVLNKDFGHAEKVSINQGSPTNANTELVFANTCADILQSQDVFTDEIISASTEEKMDKRQEDVIFCPRTAADHPPNSIETSKKFGQNPMGFATSLSLPSSFCSVSASIPTGMDEVPVSFQFGLFSGPPLIPSPLPTIQIGSIQMPLPLHEQFDSYGQLHASHPPLLHFDQINQYTTSISQSALLKAAQPLSIHPSALGHSYINQNPGSSSSNLIIQGSTPVKILEKEQPSLSTSEIVSRCLENSDSEHLTARDKVLKSQSQTKSAASDEKKDLYDLFSPSTKPDVASSKNRRSMVNSTRVRVLPHVESLSSNQKSVVVLKAPGTMPEIRGNRFSNNAKNTVSFPSLRRTQNLFANSHRPQRRGRRHFQGTEYRVKESDGTREMHCSEICNHIRQNVKPDYGNIAVAVSQRNSSRKDPVICKSAELTDEVAAPSTQVEGTYSNMSRGDKKETFLKMGVPTCNIYGGEGILKKNGLLEDDIDAPLRSGIVRIFNQPGIEASADGDGFVEVRSKRKMSNERRGQRGREFNPTSMVVKVPRRPHPTASNNTVTSRSDMVATFAGVAAAKGANSDPVIAIRRSRAALEASLSPTTGTLAMNFTDIEANLKSLNYTQVGFAADKASDGAKIMPRLSFGSNIIAHDKVSVPLGTWGTFHWNHQVSTSTISQLDDASNPLESNPRATSTMTHEKPFFSSANQLNFPFDGEKIQFGAVALPPTLPSSSQAVSSGLWPPGSTILKPPIIHSGPVNENSRISFFDKEKCSGAPCTHLDDTEAEAEAAASAVAVAAISNDEISVHTFGTGSTSDGVINGLRAPGMTRFADVVGQSASEESLVVTLPADLSVETPHSFWPPLQSIQCPRPMLSHIAGPQPSSFPFFDPNPILGRPIFPFRPQDESTGAQTQPQQNTTFGSVPGGTWSQCHSGVDSFYGSPAGFPAPFMSPAGGLAGVHPQMVFYNHFAPVEQFGQVGFSYMGTTYIPTGKQPDWKHNSEVSGMNVNKADPSNLNVVYGQQKVAHMPTPAQHLSSGAAVNPVHSPFPLFNLRPFQSPTETPVFPGHWPPIPHSIRLSSAPKQLQSLPSDLSVANAGLNAPRSAAADLPDELDELGLLESAASNSARKLAATKDLNGMPGSTNSIVSHNEDGGIGMVGSAVLTHQTISPVQQHLSPIGKADRPKVAALQASSGGGGWRQRNAFPVRNHNVGSTKMKQIYVAKTLSAAHAASS